MKPQAIARDSQGRVRIDRAMNEVRLESGLDAGANVERHIVSICDPVKGEVIQLDTVNHAATHHSAVLAGSEQKASTRSMGRYQAGFPPL